jgi:chemotaxis protein MotB
MSDRKREMSESGMLVYPQLPVPKQSRESDRKIRKSGGGGGGKVVPVLLVIALLAGAAGGFFVRPMVMEDSRLVDAENALAKQKLALAESQANVVKLQDESKKLDEQRDLLNKQLEAAKQAQDMLADKAAGTKKLEDDLAAAKKKLDATGAGSVAIDGTEVRVSISTGNLFRNGDELSSGGMRTLDKVAAALKELADKQIAVHGHTDDQPPPKPAAPKPAAPKPSKPKKGDRKDKVPPSDAPEPAFATNWELSAARALAVVHYLQDQHKIEASRLSTSAFSQYRPASKSNKAANRRIELVLTPKPAKK